jgi:hypothetical protein
MRTTLDIEVDVLAAAKELARLQGTAAMGPSQAVAPAVVAGFRPFPAQAAQPVTNEQIDRLRDEAGLPQLPACCRRA